MELRDAIVGDTIGISSHFPQVVTVTGWRNAPIRGEFSRLCWTAPGAEGVTLLSDDARVTLLREASPEVRAQIQAETETALAGMLATTEG